MARTQTMVQLSDELISLLDAEAARRGGISRSALIREILAAALEDEAAIGRAIAEGYRRIPQDTPDEWGDLMAAADRATREGLARLDAEERAAGHEPWRP